MTGKIFLSYRREDAAGFALALFGRLEQSFPAESLFMDVEGGIGAGQDFVHAIEKQVSACDAMLVLIGPDWLTAADEQGRRRLDKLDDPVRLEVESALKFRKRVIPVLVQKTEMPRADALPEPIKALARRNAVGLTQERFRADAQGLIKALEEALADAEADKRSIETLGSLVLAEFKGTPARRRLLESAGNLFWRLLHDQSIRTFAGLSRTVDSVAFSPDGRTALSLDGGAYGALKLWDVATGMEIRRFPAAVGTSVAFSPDGQTALSGHYGKEVTLWDVATGNVIRSFEGHDGHIRSVAFSPDGRSALSGSEDNTLKLWDVATGKEVRAFAGHTSPVDSVAFSPDGRSAISGCLDGAVKLWDVATGKELRTFCEHPNLVQSVAFSPDGRNTLSGWGDRLKLRDVATGKEIRSFIGHTGTVASVAFSPDSRRALSGSWDNTLKLWDVATGKEIRTFTGHTGSVRSVAISPDGRTALSGSEDHTLKLWT
jgi:hypothetical protein